MRMKVGDKGNKRGNKGSVDGGAGGTVFCVEKA
jgi:hypothetical protein